MNNDERKPLVIKEAKDTINRIKGSKVERLEVVSKVLGDEVEVLETYKGTDLEHMEYEQLIPEYLKTICNMGLNTLISEIHESGKNYLKIII